MFLHPLPVKSRASLDVPALLAAIKRDGVFNTTATLNEVAVVRNWIFRKRLPITLGAVALRDSANERTVGYALSLRERASQGEVA